MPLVTLTGIPPDVGVGDLASLGQQVKDVVTGIQEFGMTKKDISLSFVSDLRGCDSENTIVVSISHFPVEMSEGIDAMLFQLASLVGRAVKREFKAKKVEVAVLPPFSEALWTSEE